MTWTTVRSCNLMSSLSVYIVLCTSRVHVHTYIYIYIPLALGLIGRDGGLSALCYSCKFACQQSVLKTFPGPGLLPSKDGVG